MQAWVSGSMPEKQQELAALLGVPVADVTDNLTARVLSSFQVTDGGRLVCPELEALREEYVARREERSKAGKKGAEMRYRKSPVDSSAIAQPAPVAIAAPEVSGAELRRGELNRRASIGKGNEPSIAPLSDAGEDAYLRAFDDRVEPGLQGTA